MENNNEPVRLTIDKKAGIFAYLRMADSDKERAMFAKNPKDYVFCSSQLDDMETLLRKCGCRVTFRRESVALDFASPKVAVTEITRPELFNLLDLAEDNAFDVLVLANLADLGKNVGTTVDLLTRFRKAGVRVVYPDASGNPAEVF